MPAVTFFPIQSIVVVTSPIGDQAPPALAAIIIKPAYHILSFASGNSFLKMVINTMVAVRLSIIEDNKKPKIQTIQSSVLFLLVLTKLFMVEKASK
ncbi:MAG: hypothetical protein KFKLKKLM_01253 [Flavobacteriales bacterium]|nr:hypothetical protein [Flavobacteriales bacterium]